MTTGDSTDHELRLAVARRYYHQDRSKVAIAAEFGLSRFQVARMLTDARRDGLVRIEIGAPGRVDRESSAALQQELGIRRAVVISAGGASPQARLDHVGTALAAQLRAQLREGLTIGVTWSSATVTMSERLDRLPRCNVVQLGGAVYPPAGVPGSVEVARRVAAAAGTDAHTLYSPLVVGDADTASGLRRQPEIASVLKRARDVDIAVLSIGSWQPSASAVFDLLTSQEQERLTAARVCGEVSGRLFDVDGTLLPTFLDDRVVGVDAATLTAVPRLLVSSWGAFRAVATRAACRAGLVHTLVADEELASELLR